MSQTPLIVQVTDLIGRPGVSRQVDLDLPVPEGFVLELGELQEPLHLGGVIESVVEGLLVRGAVHASVAMTCGRCLRPVTEALDVDVAELYVEFGAGTAAEEDAVVEEGYEIVEGRIDLDALVRDALGPAMPYRPLCADDCRGLCASCGIDLNEADCDCAEVATDARWAALEGLRLPSGGTEDAPRGT